MSPWQQLKWSIIYYIGRCRDLNNNISFGISFCTVLLRHSSKSTGWFSIFIFVVLTKIYIGTTCALMNTNLLLHKSPILFVTYIVKYYWQFTHNSFDSECVSRSAYIKKYICFGEFHSVRLVDFVQRYNISLQTVEIQFF